MALDPHAHALVAMSDGCIGSLATLTKCAGDAFALAQVSLHPLVVVVDQLQVLVIENFITLFTEHADQLPPMAWVLLVSHYDLPKDVVKFLIDRDSTWFSIPFDLDVILAGVEHVALRFAR
jgi:hypothetical protein